MQTEIAGHLDIDGTFSASAYDPEYSTMGVAYNSTLHFSDFGLSISDCSSECHELAIEDAKSGKLTQ